MYVVAEALRYSGRAPEFAKTWHCSTLHNVTAIRQARTQLTTTIYSSYATYKVVCCSTITMIYSWVLAFISLGNEWYPERLAIEDEAGGWLKVSSNKRVLVSYHLHICVGRRGLVLLLAGLNRLTKTLFAWRNMMGRTIRTTNSTKLWRQTSLKCVPPRMKFYKYCWDSW